MTDKDLAAARGAQPATYDVTEKSLEDVEHKRKVDLKRGLTARQVQMIAIGGTIGTGLFLGTGKSLSTGGPGSMLIAYAIVGVIVYFTMLSLGEMSTYIPVAGSFNTYANRFVDEGLGFALTWNYWFNDAVSVASDLTAAQIIWNYWKIDFPGWALSLIFLVFLIAINAIDVKAYGEIEYWLSLLKVITIVLFIIIGICVNLGANKGFGYIGFQYWKLGDAPFVGGIGGFASVFVTAAFAYGGTESIGITAGETKNPRKNVPRVIRNVFWRILMFYIMSIFVIGIDVPYNEPNINQKNARDSPFTLVFKMTGFEVAPSFINAVVLTSVISAGNHALFAGTRLLYTLGEHGHAPKIFTKLTKNRVPIYSLLTTAAISCVCFASSFVGTGTLWNWLQNLVGVSNQISWIAIGLTSYRFRKAFEIQGKNLNELPLKSPLYPYGPIFVIVANSVLVLVQGWSSFKSSPSGGFDFVSFLSYYIQIPMMAIMWLGWKFLKGTKVVKYEEMDLETDRYYDTAEDLRDSAKESGGVRGFFKRIGQFFF
ncbi:Basic amino-acid permease [Basidiobolus ranarum]|uniref:Basic amino-acid permease n=1 Tax=Basidiobolus ranarum TaxID=34480 RepID=A0ABR2X0P7_9FUNG